MEKTDKVVDLMIQSSRESVVHKNTTVPLPMVKLVDNMVHTTTPIGNATPSPRV